MYQLKVMLGDIVTFEDHAAGIQLVAELPDCYDETAIAAAASIFIKRETFSGVDTASITCLLIPASGHH